MKKLIENYKKPTPSKWRKIGDIAMFAIPIIELQFQTLPIEIDPTLKWGITTVLILFKAYTNTKVEANHYEGQI
jgi:hypothetical protein